MIKVDYNTGILHLDDIIIMPKSNLDELDALAKKFKIKKSFERNDLKIFVLFGMNNGEMVVSLSFKMDILTAINISTAKQSSDQAFVVSQKERWQILAWLSLIGGIKNYPWGGVDLNDDRKGSELSILIKYL